MINSIKKIIISLTTALILTTSSVIIPVGNNIIITYASTYTGNSIVDYLNSVGINSSFSNRANLAVQYGIVYSTSQYAGSPDQNTRLLQAMRNSSNNTGTYNSNSIVDYLNSIGVNSSFSNRANLAVQYGIVYSTSQYTGSPDQNTRLLQTMRNGSTQSIPSRASTVINYAKSKLGSTEYSNLCQRFVRICFEKAGIYGDAASAKDAWRKWGVSSSMNNIPIGACVYFDGNDKKNGHVGIYIGNGEVIHAVSTVKINTLDYLNNSNVGPYLGWGYQAGQKP